LRRICSYLSLAFGQTLLGMGLVRKPDLILVPVGPMTLGIPALWYRTIWRVPFVLNVQDLWPESVAGSGMLNARWAERILSRFCTFVYRRAGHVIALSRGYQELLIERGVTADRATVIHNWCDPSLEQRDFRATSPDTFGLQGAFNVVYAGNLGELQGLESVVRAALLLKDRLPRVRFVFVGGGTQEATLRRLALDQGASNVTFISRLPLERLGEVFHYASLLLVHLKDNLLSAVGIPQKIQAYLATGIPVLAGVRGDAAELLMRSGGGFLCSPESPDSIADVVARLASMSPEELRTVGQRGRRFYVENLSFETGVRKLMAVLTRAASPSARVPAEEC
jgi:glycosyltransferase involved in cell wall biosynthesis